MQKGEVFLVIGLFILIIIYSYYYTKCKHRFKKLMFGVISGVALLYPAAYLMSSLGYIMKVNIFTLIVSGVLGMPGVVLLIVSKIFG